MNAKSMLRWFAKVLRDLPEEEAPVTYSLIGIISAIFAFEFGMMVRYGLPQIQVFATGIFGVYPLAAWVVAPFLHQGLFHWIGSVLGLLFIGSAVERHWPRWRYIVFILVSGYLATAAGAAVMLAFSESQIAFYGTSGIIFGLAGFALVHIPWSHQQVTRVEWFAAFIGLCALISVIIDPLTGPYFDPHWINGGHTMGFVIGLVAGSYSLNCCDLHH